jgi:hypothetical protein
MAKTTRWQRELADDTKQADYLIIGARTAYGNQAVDDALNNEVYYIIPPNMIYVRCPQCEAQIGVDYIHLHIREHRGYHRCQVEGCADRRFQTYRGYMQHRRRAHPKPDFPGGSHV